MEAARLSSTSVPRSTFFERFAGLLMRVFQQAVGTRFRRTFGSFTPLENWLLGYMYVDPRVPSPPTHPHTPGVSCHKIPASRGLTFWRRLSRCILRNLISQILKISPRSIEQTNEFLSRIFSGPTPLGAVPSHSDNAPAPGASSQLATSHPSRPKAQPKHNYCPPSSPCQNRGIGATATSSINR